MLRFVHGERARPILTRLLRKIHFHSRHGVINRIGANRFDSASSDANVSMRAESVCAACPRSARTVIFLSRIIKPRRFYPAGYCLSCKYYQNTSRRVARVQPPPPLRMHRMCAARGGRASDIRVAKLSGFHLAARPDWTDRHCQRVTLAASSSSALRTRHAHSRGLTGIIRRYYLREGSHARIAAALPGRVSCFNPRSCLPAFRSPFCHVPPSFYGEAPSRLGQNWEIT